jgi:hypothetical protein
MLSRSLLLVSLLLSVCGVSAEDMPPYTWQPTKWWFKYREIRGTGPGQLHKCEYLDRWPLSGDHCVARDRVEYSCMFGTKWECEEGDAEPEYICDCTYSLCPTHDWDEQANPCYVCRLQAPSKQNSHADIVTERLLVTSIRAARY